MSIESNIKVKFKKQIEIFYESLVNSLDHKIQNAVQNLILFGYTDTGDIISRTSSYFNYHCSMNPDEGIVNLSVDFDWDLNGELSSMEEDIFTYIHRQDTGDDEIENDWAVFINMFKEVEKQVIKKFPQIDSYEVKTWSKRKAEFFEKYIGYLCEKYTQQFFIDKSSFFDKKFTKELSYLINFFIENKIMPDHLTIHESGDGGGKDGDWIFELDDDWERIHHDFLEIQVSDDELLLRKKNELLHVTLIFKDKKLRDDLNQNLISLYKKKTNIFEQERLRGSKINSFYIECKIDWCTS